MACRVYVCNAWKSLKLSRSIHFQNGLYATENEDEQRIIESNNAFGVQIHWQDPPVIAKAQEQHKQDESEANARAVEERKILEEIEAEDKAKREQAEKDSQLSEEDKAREKLAAQFQTRRGKPKEGE